MSDDDDVNMWLLFPHGALSVLDRLSDVESKFDLEGNGG